MWKYQIQRKSCFFFMKYSVAISIYFLFEGGATRGSCMPCTISVAGGFAKKATVKGATSFQSLLNSIQERLSHLAQNCDELGANLAPSSSQF